MSRMRLAVRTITAMLVLTPLFGGRMAVAQLTITPGGLTVTSQTEYRDASSAPLPAAFTYYSATGANETAGNLVGMSLKGDWDYKLSRNPGDGY